MTSKKTVSHNELEAAYKKKHEPKPPISSLTPEEMGRELLIELCNMIETNMPEDEKRCLDLIDSGADLTITTELWEQTALHVATERKKVAIVKRLVEKGASIDARDLYNETPLMFVQRRGHLSIVKIFMDKMEEEAQARAIAAATSPALQRPLRKPKSLKVK